MEVEKNHNRANYGNDKDDKREELREIERKEEQMEKQQGEDKSEEATKNSQELDVIDINSKENSYTSVLLQPPTTVKQFTIPKLEIEGEIDQCPATEEKPFNRKLLICFTEEKDILSFYWTKIAKRSDKLLLVHVIRESTTETDAKKEREKSSGLASKFKKECEQQGIVCKHIFPTGNPEEVICEVAKQFKPHLVVAGSKMTKKHSSVSKYVLRNSSSPVLLVPVVRGHLRKGFTSVAAVAQAAIRFGMNSETIL